MGDRRWHEILDEYDEAAAGALEVFRGRQGEDDRRRHPG